MKKISMLQEQGENEGILNEIRQLYGVIAKTYNTNKLKTFFEK